MTERLFPTPLPGVLLLIGSTRTSVPYVHLHLESRRRFYPDVPLIVHDTGGTSGAAVQELCAAYGALHFAPPERIGPHGEDIAAALLAVQAAQEMGLDLAVLMSDTFMPLTNWVPQLQHLASQMQYATYAGVGLRPECVAFHVPSWAAGDTLDRLERAGEAGLATADAVAEYLHELARDVHRASQCVANTTYERLYPPTPEADAYGLWPWPGDDAARRPFLLRPGADTALDYHRLALAYGLGYQHRDFLGPAFARTEGRDRQAAAPPASPPEHGGRMRTATYEARVVTHERGDFAAVTGSRVLIYLPHGFGDWVQFAAVLPLLDPTNRYYMTRLGDDTCSVLEGCEDAAPLYSGSNTEPADVPRPHFGLEYDDMDGTVRSLEMPLSLHRQCRTLGIDVVYWTGLPDPWGEGTFPYHTKARWQLPHMVSAQRLSGLDLSRPLRSPLSFQVPPWLTRWVEARLTAYGGFGERKLCLITRNGYTTIGKNWGHLYRDEVPVEPLREGQECRDFMRLLLRKDPRWMFLVMEDKLYGGDDTVRSADLHAHSYAEMFGPVGGQTPPFGLVLKVLTNLASLSVGIPSGPYHLSMIKPGLPTVGLWIEQLPSWYDEPKAESVHLIGRGVRDGGRDRRPGSDLDRPGMSFRALRLDTKRIPGEAVFEAAEELLS